MVNHSRRLFLSFSHVFIHLVFKVFSFFHSTQKIFRYHSPWSRATGLLSDCCSLCWTFSCHNVDILKCKQLVKRETSSWIAFRFRGTREEWEDHLMPSEFCFPASTSTRFFRRLALLQLNVLLLMVGSRFDYIEEGLSTWRPNWGCNDSPVTLPIAFILNPAASDKLRLRTSAWARSRLNRLPWTSLFLPPSVDGFA